MYTAARGDEGRRDTVCLTAGDAAGAIRSLPPACVVVVVRRCVYCLGDGDTLQSVMLAVAGDANWLRVWAASGNDDGDPDTATVADPDRPGAAVAAGAPVRVNLGALYEAEAGDTLAGLAARFQTTVRLLLSLNPDLAATGGGGVDRVAAAAGGLAAGQELCVVPCTHVAGPDVAAAVE